MGKRGRHRDPIADHVEWNENRYNPGHYLGGKMPHFVKASDIDPRTRRLWTLAMAIAVIIGFAYLGLPASLHDGRVVIYIVPVVAILVAIRVSVALARSSAPKGEGARRAKRNRKRRKRRR